MAVLVSDILDHPCDTDDEKMKTIYETDYVKRGKMFHVSTNDFFEKSKSLHYTSRYSRKLFIKAVKPLSICAIFNLIQCD